MGRPRKEGTKTDRRREARRTLRDHQLKAQHFSLSVDELERQILTCEACGRSWYWPIPAIYRDEHYIICSSSRPWVPPPSWDALPFPVKHADPPPQPTLPLRHKPW